MIQVLYESKQGAHINLFLSVSSKRDEYSLGWVLRNLNLSYVFKAGFNDQNIISPLLEQLTSFPSDNSFTS